jgi:hypothetical protein
VKALIIAVALYALTPIKQIEHERPLKVVTITLEEAFRLNK